ncbi:MAG: hypothetical protein A2Y23_02120 [Clostridiales bacterium GWB2_37_7]|nr:MAG: hypothetical protein A2Y23_02120 [Clostridiales bacterium GWB2_37_7]
MESDLKFKFSGWLCIIFAVILIAAMFSKFIGLLKIIFMLFAFPFVFWQLKTFLNLKYNYAKLDLYILALIVVEVGSLLCTMVLIAFIDYIKNYLLIINDITALLTVAKGIIFFTIAIKLYSIRFSKSICIVSAILGIVYALYGLLSSLRILLVIQRFESDIFLMLSKIILFMPTVFLSMMLLLIGRMFLNRYIQGNSKSNEIIVND